ncbi:MAG TPA: FAD binding domain-containing protein [Xanthobacteraceae bacterium]|nr:FAD binding domain-containing protein [Xanthobacteraceae bacterium]
MKPVRFDYCRAETVADAVGLLAELREDAAVLAGGMTLGPMLNLRIARPRTVIDIGRIAELRALTPGKTTLTTGATLVQADALESAIVRRDVPLLALALPFVGHFQTRNRGTLGGSVAHADPSAEIPLCLVVTGGTVVLRTRRRERRVPARKFFLGALATERRPDELLVALEWPRAPADAGHAFDEIAQRHGDFAIAAAACQVRLDGAGRIADLAVGLGGVDSRPVALDTSALLGRPGDDATVTELAEGAMRAVVPMDDQVADAGYRLALMRVLIGRVVPRAIADARTRTP